MMSGTPASRALAPWIAAIVDLGEIPAGFGVDRPGSYPMFGTGGWDRKRVEKMIQNANRAGSTALYKIDKAHYEGLQHLKNGLAARGILDSGETNFQLAEFANQYAAAQAQARAAAMSAGAGKSEQNASTIAQNFQQYVDAMGQAAINAANQPYNWNVPYSNPNFGQGSLLSGGNVPGQIRNLFGG